MSDVWQLLGRQREDPVMEADLPMSWEELDHDLLAALPFRRRSRYGWNGEFAPRV